MSAICPEKCGESCYACSQNDHPECSGLTFFELRKPLPAVLRTKEGEA